MIRNKDSRSKYAFSLLAALIVHAAILAFLKYDPNDFGLLTNLSTLHKNLGQPLKLDDIKIIKPEEVEKFRRVGIKNGKKDLQRPDLSFKPPTPPPSKATPEVQGKKGAPAKLSLDKLTPQLPKPVMTKKAMDPRPSEKTKTPNPIAKDFLHATPSNDGSHFYFNPKQQKVITQAHEQEILKEEAIKNVSAPMNKATEKISNFEIRYERPEGVSEDELNSDEKAYYSFYVRSYQNYFSKIYSNYEKIVVERPGLANVFDRKHLLIGKIDYDENGDIITVKILKSSDSDDLHYFFEETLKQLTQPNPPKVFTKNRKQFSIYYQLQIN
jgi:hypothetical protein